MKRTIISVGAVFALAFLITGCAPSATHFQEVKSAVFTGDEKFNTHVEISLGVIPIWLAGTVAGFVDEPEAREASSYIKHVGRVDIGVYEVQDSLVTHFGEITQRVRLCMLDHGFEPVVQVKENKECVGVYVAGAGTEIPGEAFVVVMERNQVVLVRVRGNFEKLARAVLQNHQEEMFRFNKALRQEIVL